MIDLSLGLATFKGGRDAEKFKSLRQFQLLVSWISWVVTLLRLFYFSAPIMPKAEFIFAE
jgi:hypothetical protein